MCKPVFKRIMGGIREIQLASKMKNRKFENNKREFHPNIYLSTHKLNKQKVFEFFRFLNLIPPCTP